MNLRKRKKRKNKLCFFLSLVMMILTGASCENKMSGITHYDLSVENVGETIMRSTLIEIGEKQSRVGGLYKGAADTHLSFDGGFAETATVSYSLDGTKKKLTKEVAIPWVQIKDAKGHVRLIFFVNSDTGEIKVDITQREYLKDNRARRFSLLTGKILDEWQE